ncbi:mRNA interferase HigB [Hymenobacter psychrotolerans DSM 18569]|jgi:mRNA interferase HigB|uniref:mRNA interferase HigB n=2 Tax=Hymenobacter TaxID=89966 RepID=A0A1M7EIX4_9BACT|nr:type II toxin-antitoxin system HigB family toxin [Hymenobacter guriensis]SHL91722.1 mRNA interferase HigB [Hymenobacter psychrotolerans DSM 18569]
MEILTKKRLRDYGNTQHPDVAQALLEWFEMAEAAEWQTAADVPARYVGNNRYVFNILGNRFRLIVRIFFPAYQVYVRFVGTHAEYDRIPDTSTV